MTSRERLQRRLVVVRQRIADLEATAAQLERALEAGPCERLRGRARRLAAPEEDRPREGSDAS